MRSAPTRAAAVSLLLLSSTFDLLLSHNAGAGPLPTELFNSDSAWLSQSSLGSFVHRVANGRAVCLEATAEQTDKIKHRNPNLNLAPLGQNSQGYRSAYSLSGLTNSSPIADRTVYDTASSEIVNQSGLKIILRATSQLNNTPAAVDAFKRAAAQWENLIRTNLSVIIDVDYGPTIFGNAYDDDQLSGTDAQIVKGNALYSGVRNSLLSRAFDSSSIAVYSTLPTIAVKTSEGTSSGIASPTATLRALELIDPVADLSQEATTFGLPPAIALNSRFKFDFDASDGIAADSFDLEAIVAHEIGHVLGFVSCVGQRDMVSADLMPSVWDLFRVRPDAIENGLNDAERVLTPGGEQSFYDGDSAILLSTGRPDGSGGDGREPAHWKDDSISGHYIGIMDPTISAGDHYFITDSDAAVLSTLGYQAKRVTEPVDLIPLTSGQPQNGGMIAPPPNAGVLSHLQYSIGVLPGAEQLKIDLNGNQDVDLFVRFGQRVFINGFHPETDYVSAGETGVESITINSASSPPLRAGTYFIAIANFGPGDADFAVKASVTGGTHSRAPVVFNVRPQLEGDTLNLRIAAIDLERDSVNAEVSLLDNTGRSVAATSNRAIGSNTAAFEAALSYGGMNALPAAIAAKLVLTDRDGNHSPEVTINFSGAEPGGIILNGASFADARLTIRTAGIESVLEVEINGRIAAPPRSIKIKGSSKLLIKGDSEQLGLRTGANRIRVKNEKGWSNILIMNF